MGCGQSHAKVSSEDATIVQSSSHNQVPGLNPTGPGFGPEVTKKLQQEAEAPNKDLLCPPEEDTGKLRGANVSAMLGIDGLQKIQLTKNDTHSVGHLDQNALASPEKTQNEGQARFNSELMYTRSHQS